MTRSNSSAYYRLDSSWHRRLFYGIHYGTYLFYMLGLIYLTCACGAGEKKPQSKVDSELRVSLAELLIKAKAYDEAIPIVKKALHANPKDARLYYLLGVTLRDKGVYSEAENMFKRGIKLNPKLSVNFNALGVLLSMQRRYSEAETSLKHAIELDPKVARYYNNLGFVLYLVQRYPEAIDAYRNAIREAPSEQRVYINLAFALGAVRQDQEALRLFTQVLSKAQVANNLGIIYEQRQQDHLALQSYQKALDLNPRLKDARQNLDHLRLKIRRTPLQGKDPYIKKVHSNTTQAIDFNHDTKSQVNPRDSKVDSKVKSKQNKKNQDKKLLELDRKTVIPVHSIKK
jgi:Flp pilus assembly protein TadD